MERTTFVLTAEQVQELKELAALPIIVVAGRTPLDLIQRYWEKLGRELGFDVRTVDDIDQAKNSFTALATSTS